MNSPDGICFCPSTNKVLFLDTVATRLYQIDPSTNTITGSLIDSQLNKNRLCYCPLNDRLYVGYQGGNWFVVNPHTLTIETSISGSTANGPITYCPSNERIYAFYTSGSIIVINPSNNTIERTISCGNATSITYYPVLDRIYITTSGDQMFCLNPQTNIINNTISIVAHPQGSVYIPSNDRLYVVTHDANTITSYFCT